METVSIALPEPLLDLIVVRVVARLTASQTPTEPWVGAEDAARHLACRRQRIYDLVNRRAIPHRKEGSRLLFKLSQLDAWIGSGGAA
jgi:excisionase family DNA binding protein